MSRYARRTDANHGEIVKTFRALNASVVSLAAVGAGVPDLLVAYRRETILVEVKDGAKTASQRKLTPAQKKFHATWGGLIVVLTSKSDVYDLMANWDCYGAKQAVRLMRERAK